MTTLHRSPRLPGGLLAPMFALAVLLAACSSAGTAATAGTTSGPPAASPSPSVGSGAPSASPGGSLVPGGGGEYVVPRPGQVDVHPIAADSLAAQVDGHHVIVTITYTSGVEPCSVLDTIVVERGDHTFAITLRQGHGPGNEVCIMIARVMQTQVDLGDLDPGTYTISDTMRGADPIQVIVS
jgi:hypothetical protein